MRSRIFQLTVYRSRRLADFILRAAQFNIANHLLRLTRYGSGNDARRRPRILVLDAWMIKPDQDSGSYRMLMLLDLLNELGYRVTFIPANLEYHPKYVRQLRRLGVEVAYYPILRSIEPYLRSMGPCFDVVLISRIIAAWDLIDIVRKAAPQARLIFDTVDLHFLRERREAELCGNAEMIAAAEARKEAELAVAAKADVTLVVSQVEKEMLGKMAPGLNVAVVSNIHEIHGSSTPFGERSGILFLGGFKHMPNVDAVTFYVNEIWPSIRKTLTGVKTYIVGSLMPPEITGLASEEIRIAADVPDLRPYFETCRVFAAPLRYGAGVKGKINMSMSYGLPTVGTSLATEGMHIREGEDALIADTPAEFAAKVVRLHEDEALWRKLSRNGLKNVERHFSRRVAKTALREILETRSAAERPN